MSESSVYQAPKKPWEVDGPEATTTIYTPSQPVASSMAPAASYDQYGSYNYGYQPSGYIGGYYGQRPYGTYGTSLPYLSSIETGANTVMEQMRRLVQAITSLAQFLDSTMYAGWSSATALAMAFNNLKKFKTLIFEKWLRLPAHIARYISLRPVFSLLTSKIAWFAIGIPVAAKLLSSANQAKDGTATNEYASDQPGHLQLKPGEKVRVLYEENGWYYGENALGQKGCFPSSHVSVQ